MSLEAIREVCCVMVFCTNTGPASCDSSRNNLSRSFIYNSRDLVNHTYINHRLAAFTRCKYVLFFGSEFSRHPEGLSFSGLSFRDIQGSEFFGSEV